MRSSRILSPQLSGWGIGEFVAIPMQLPKTDCQSSFYFTRLIPQVLFCAEFRGGPSSGWMGAIMRGKQKSEVPQFDWTPL